MVYSIKDVVLTEPECEITGDVRYAVLMCVVNGRLGLVHIDL